MNLHNTDTTLRILCRIIAIPKSNVSQLWWLIGSPFFPSVTIISLFKCLHTLPSNHSSPDVDFSKESAEKECDVKVIMTWADRGRRENSFMYSPASFSFWLYHFSSVRFKSLFFLCKYSGSTSHRKVLSDKNDIKLILPKGFEVIGALVAKSDSDSKRTATEAIDAAVRLRKLLHYDTTGGLSADQFLVGAAVDSDSGGNIHYFVSRNGSLETLGCVSSIIQEDQPEKFIWQRGCILRCQLPIKLPVYYPAKNLKELENAYTHAADAFAHKFRDSQVIYVLEGQNGASAGGLQPTIISGSDLEPHLEGYNKTDGESFVKSLSCSHIRSKADNMTNFISLEKNADIIRVSIFSNHSRSPLKPTAPIVEYYPAVDDAKMLVVEHELDVLCYVAKDVPLISSISKLIVPALVDQLHAMRKMIFANLLRRHPQLRPYHFIPRGMLHPVTVIYDLEYGETEMEQVEVRRSIHLRLGLPLDRPLLRIANAIHLTANNGMRKNFAEKGMLKDVHLGIPSSGVSGGTVSLIQGSYEYYHYLLDGFDDSGWGCAYRSLQTIISWFRLQHYSSIDAPSHREIQQSLVEMGDKDPSFVGSREWIGAIELSFVLDILLGVSCKVINVRSGSELPEKCRELALHFETQGTPVMIGGGVLAYTLLGVDYNEASGDSAFLILDPHYTGNDDLKKIVNGGWCGWKKAVDSKGKHFFLHDKFYNLLLPQRPLMV